MIVPRIVLGILIEDIANPTPELDDLRALEVKESVSVAAGVVVRLRRGEGMRSVVDFSPIPELLAMFSVR